MRHIKTCGFCLALGLNLVSAIATAETVVVVSAKNPLTALSKNQVTDIFFGKTSRFPDGTPVTPINQAEGSPVRDEFYATVAGKSQAQVKAYWSKVIFTGRGQPPKEVESSGEAKKLLAVNPGAISYIDKSAVDASVKVITIGP